MHVETATHLSFDRVVGGAGVTRFDEHRGGSETGDDWHGRADDEVRSRMVMPSALVVLSL